MSLSKKLQDHFITTPVSCMVQGVKVASRVTEDQHPIVQVTGMIVGQQGGALMGGMKLMSPTSIIETLMRTDEEIDRRYESIWKDENIFPKLDD